MNHDQQNRPDNDKRLEVALLLISALLAWPAFLLGATSRQLIKRHTDDPFLFWIGAGVLGAIGAWVLYRYENPYPFFLTLSYDIAPLVLHLSGKTVAHFALDALPLWERSILLFPWLTLLIELFTPTSLEDTLRAQERKRRTIQRQKSKRAARLARKAPDFLNGQGVLGTLIDNPND